jgi:hypothetical protein
MDVICGLAVAENNRHDRQAGVREFGGERSGYTESYPGPSISDEERSRGVRRPTDLFLFFY